MLRHRSDPIRTCHPSVQIGILIVTAMSEIHQRIIRFYITTDFFSITVLSKYSSKTQAIRSGMHSMSFYWKFRFESIQEHSSKCHINSSKTQM